MWSVWNEPNQPQFLLPQYRKKKPYSPVLYRSLYKAAYKAIRSVPENRKDKILIGETSPRGNEHIVHPLTFLRGIACLKSNYKRAKKCGKLKADGYAHHAYTTRTGPRFVPPDKNDVTIAVISRLVKALDRAGRAGGLPKRLKIYLTEFGIQSFPDKISGVPLARQPAYYAISEKIAYVNSRVALFSQYLMRDDQPRSSGYRYRGFESGLRRRNGKAKPAYKAFANPLAAERSRNHDVLWGRVRPEPGVTGDDRGQAQGQEVLDQAAAAHHEFARRVRPEHAAPQELGLPRALDGQRQAPPHRPADQGLLKELGSRPGAAPGGTGR